MTSRSRLALCLLVLFLAVPAGADEPEPLSFSPWIGLASVDRGGRTPFNRSTVFERYLWKSDSPPPLPGETVKGRGGETATWKALPENEKGRVESRGMAVAYRTVTAEEEGVWLVAVHRAGSLYVNGEPFGGDVYGHGITQVPVLLRKGANDLFVAGFRGDFRVAFEKPPAPVFIADRDPVLPEPVEGEQVVGTAGFLVVNATNEPVEGLFLSAASSGGVGTAGVPFLPPLGQRKRSLQLGFVSPRDREVTVVLARDGEALHERTFPLTLRKRSDAQRRTFVSWIDDSAQYYGFREPAGERSEDRETGLVLSLHGASVDGWNQANAYAPKPDFFVVAPTNRRPFGFDWQDWGRQDAYEALRDALDRTGVDRRNVHLTGHSMGGHGTWHLAVNDPDGFASAAPSAGWSSFDTYAGGRPDDVLARLWKAADAASLTDEWLGNLQDLPLYVLHGDKDDNVPVSEAKSLVRKLEGIAKDLEVHYAEGQGHWWDARKEVPGADCVDWPGIFAMFRRARIPEAPTEIQVTFPDLSYDHRHHWVLVDQPALYGSPARVEGAWDEASGTLTLATKNVRRLRLDLPDAWTPKRILLDGKEVDPTDLTLPNTPPASEKRPARMGPFKRAFDNHFTLVYGTRGTDAEDAALLASARYDAEQWRYRANGDARCVPDTWYLQYATVYRDRNVVLYGNATTNAAWDVLVPAGCPIRPERGKVRAGVKTWEGDAYGVLFVYPRKGSDRALVAAVADTGVPGSRLNFRIPYFLSGVGIPDFVVYGPEVLKSGDQGVRAAGFFDATWQLAQ